VLVLALVEGADLLQLLNPLDPRRLGLVGTPGHTLRRPLLLHLLGLRDHVRESAAELSGLDLRLRHHLDLPESPYGLWPG
jgi:hypothetical protein